jgi:hypothetical protein
LKDRSQSAPSEIVLNRALLSLLFHFCIFFYYSVHYGTFYTNPNMHILLWTRHVWVYLQPCILNKDRSHQRRMLKLKSQSKFLFLSHLSLKYWLKYNKLHNVHFANQSYFLVNKTCPGIPSIMAFQKGHVYMTPIIGGNNPYFFSPSPSLALNINWIIWLPL